MNAISFGDTVRIRATVATEQLGLAGRKGLVHGFTTPSDTGVQVIGSGTGDCALSVKIEGQNDPLWFDPNLVEFVDHAPGTTIRIGKRGYTRGTGGEWIEDTRADDD
ncbi:MAG TPA: hypothetical protein VGG56_10675 [Terracidiphilus sp.]|jgi:hypothetical protein